MQISRFEKDNFELINEVAELLIENFPHSYSEFKHEAGTTMDKNKEVLLGYAEVDITPKIPVETVGFDRQDNVARGILHNLIAQIAIWEISEERFCIISIDSLGFTVEITDTLRDIITRQLCIRRERIMICFSHTHSAPNAGKEKVYFDFVCTQILNGIDGAIKTLSPVKAAWGITKAGIGINRRNENGVLDERISILKIVDTATNQVKLILLRVTAHANVLTSDNYFISSDYFGTTRNLLEKKYCCKVMITQGAAGNVRPKYQQSDADFLEKHSREASMMKVKSDVVKRRFDESMAALDKMALEICKSVGVIIESLIPQPIFRIEIFSEIKTFSADVPTMERAREIADEAMREAEIDGTDWLAEIEELRINKVQQQNANIEIQYFVINNGCWCGVANEVMCEIALDISQRANDNLLYFGGYTNGCDGYLPTTDEFNKGGFEVLWSYLLYYKYHGRVMPLKEDTADKLAQIVSKKWKEYK
jgi:hypothetical protein